MSMRYGETNLSQGSLFWHLEALPRDRFVCPYLTLMINSFSCTLFVPTLELITILPKNTPHIHDNHFVLTSFFDALVTLVSDKVTCRPLQPMSSTGSEQKGQNIRVRTVFLTLTKILDLLVVFFSSGMQEYYCTNDTFCTKIIVV